MPLRNGRIPLFGWRCGAIVRGPSSAERSKSDCALWWVVLQAALIRLVLPLGLTRSRPCGGWCKCRGRPYEQLGSRGGGDANGGGGGHDRCESHPHQKLQEESESEYEEETETGRSTAKAAATRRTVLRSRPTTAAAQAAAAKRSRRRCRRSRLGRRRKRWASRAARVRVAVDCGPLEAGGRRRG